MKKNDESGSTTIEALVALLILSIAGAALVAGSRGGITAAAGAQRAVKNAITVLRLDDTLRRSALQVRIPYWDRSVVLTSDNSSLSIPWCNGNPTETLLVGIEGESLILQRDKETIAFQGIKNIELNFVVDKEKLAKGIDLRYEIGGRKVHTIAPFGASALAKGTP